MGEDTLENSFMESLGNEEGRRKRSLAVACEGERELRWGEEQNEEEEERDRAAEPVFKVGRQ
jgi:hypothetical protein